MDKNRVIQGICETHLEVRDLDRSVAFYESLGLTLGLKHGKGAFFWVTQPGEHLLGLWSAAEYLPVSKRHFAFQVSLDHLLAAKQWLSEKGISPVPAFGRDPVEPIVHPWMPAATVYFDDPDGHSLKLLAMLPGEPQNIPGVLYYSEWLSQVKS